MENLSLRDYSYALDYLERMSKGNDKNADFALNILKDRKKILKFAKLRKQKILNKLELQNNS